jgi:hypothetical protein
VVSFAHHMLERIPKLLTEQQVEVEYGIPRRTLQGDRWRGDEVPFVKLGRRVYYRVEDLEQHINTCRRMSTSDRGRVETVEV